MHSQSNQVKLSKEVNIHNLNTCKILCLSTHLVYFVLMQYTKGAVKSSQIDRLTSHVCPPKKNPSQDSILRPSENGICAPYPIPITSHQFVFVISSMYPCTQVSRRKKSSRSPRRIEAHVPGKRSCKSVKKKKKCKITSVKLQGVRTEE